MRESDQTSDLAAAHQPNQERFRVIHSEDVQWRPFPAFPPEARLAVLVADPTTSPARFRSNTPIRDRSSSRNPWRASDRSFRSQTRHPGRFAMQGLPDEWRRAPDLAHDVDIERAHLRIDTMVSAGTPQLALRPGPVCKKEQAPTTCTTAPLAIRRHHLAIRPYLPAGMEIEISHLIDALPGLIWTAFPDGRAAFVNQRWCEYTGLRAEDAVGPGWLAAIHPDDRNGFQDGWNAILDSGNEGQMEARLRRADGEYRWFNFRVAPLRDETRDAPMWCGIASYADGTVPDFRLQRFAESVPTQLIFLTRSGELEFANGAVLSYYGQTLEELKGWATSSVIHPDDLARIFKLLERTFTAGEPYDAHVRLRRADGVYRWFRARMIPSLDANGNTVRFCSVQTDVDDLKRAENLLTGEVRLLEMVARRRPLAEVLDALCRLVEDIAGGCFCGILLLDSSRTRFRVGGGPSLPESYNAVLDGMAIDPTYGTCSLAVALKTSIIAADVANDPRWAESGWRALMVQHGLVSCWSVPVLSAREEVLGVFSIYRRDPVSPTTSEQELIDRFTKIAGISIECALADTALQESEAALRRAHSHLTEAQRLSHTGSFTWDVLADEHTWSEEIYRIFGFEPGVKVTMPQIQAAIYPEDLPAVAAVIGRVVEGEDFELVFRIVARGGALRYAHVVGHRSEQITERLVFLGALQDVTESKVAEAALNKARADLAHVARVMTLSALTASIAHEVNQPLAGIVTNANTCLRMLASDPPNLEGARTTAQRTLRDGNRASEVIQRLRSLFARNEPMTEPFDLNDAAREVLALSSSELQRHRAIVHTDFGDGLPAARGDRVQLQQVILNLLLNAADAMKVIEHRPRDVVLTTSRTETNQLRLSVRDVGVGINPRHIEKLFDAFYTTKADGMGIGLSISRSIIESHEGRLWATANEDGPGATFSFSIPC